ncbi:MAG: DUF3849 domain-containing protein [Oscillospiraceae bacterium]|jgi:antirestriction protein ArdC|nr:DUF3849 domain-containing protein [Oscillospiraceae bacterium]
MPDNITATLEKVDKKEQLREITEKLEQGIKDVFEGEKFKECLDVMAKFHNYSFNNTLLIAMQNPEATKVAGFNSWKNKFGRFVNPGEKGIQILAPAPFKVIVDREKRDPETGHLMRDANDEIMTEKAEETIPYFKPVYVFDVEQTKGKPLPTLTNDIFGDVKNYEKFSEALNAVSPYEIVFDKIKEDGLCDFGNQRITINEGMSQAQTVLAKIHEITHATLHNKDLNKDDLDKPKDTKTKEVEAEAVAYVVCQHYGIETAENSFGYIADWSSGKEMPELKNSLETIRGAAHELITKIDSQLFDKDLEQKQEQTAEKPEAERNQTASGERKSNIIGNTPYIEIADKKYFKMDNKIADKFQAELEAGGIKYSGSVNKNKKTTTFTVAGADEERVRKIEATVNPQKAMEEKKPDKGDIFGNVKYSEIKDKAHFPVDSTLSFKITAALDEKGIKFSGKDSDNNKSVFTLEKADTDVFREVERAVKAQEKQAEIISTVKSTEIEVKSFFKINNDLATKAAGELEAQGVRFYGEPGENNLTTFIVEKADAEKFKTVIASVKAAERDNVAARTLPEKSEKPVEIQPEAPQEKVYDLSFGHLGNGVTVWNKAEEVNNDYRTVAHIDPDRSVKFYDKEMPEDVKERINTFAKTEEMSISATQNVSVFSVPPVEPEINPYEIVKNGLDGHSPEQLNEFLNVVNAEMENVQKQAHNYYAKRENDVNSPDAPGAFDVKLDELHDIKMSIVNEIEKQTAEKEIPPIFLGTLEEAVEKGDKMLFHDSNRINQECAAALDKAILTHSEPTGNGGGAYYNFSKALEEVTEKYGTERVTAVIAHTVNKQSWDGRLSQENKDWAKDIETPKVDYIPLNTHLAVFDGFTDYVRVAQEKDVIIGKLLENIQGGEPEDYDGEVGLAEIKETLQAKPISELRAELKSMEQQREADYAEHVEEHAAREEPATPTVAELKETVDKSESISLMDLAKAVHNEQKPSIKARIKADKEKKAAQGKQEPALDNKKDKSTREERE